MHCAEHSRGSHRHTSSAAHRLNMCEVVISGIGCNFSQSSNVQDFGHHLLDYKHLVEKTKRWRDDVFTTVCGHVSFDHFDEHHFRMNTKLAKTTDPTLKVAYMCSFEALVDAGYHPDALRGSNTCVYACLGTNEYEQKAVQILGSRMDGYVIMGLSRTMLSNRLSYFFDFKGPSFAMDASWAGGHQSIQLAAEAIRDGQCDGALVMAASISRFGETSRLLNELGIVTDEGVTRSFDENGSGVVRSDGVVALFLQRADLAKRCYARVLAANASVVGPPCDLNPTLLSPVGMQDFLIELYRKHGIDPKKIAYLEADGNGNRIRDACELSAIDKALVQGAARATPLPIGSVKSNIGHVDCANALAAICKIVVALETGTIPATINYKQPNAMASGLVEGRLRVVDKNTPLHLAADSVLAVNTVGLSSMVGHTVLAGSTRGSARDQDRDPAQNLPRLVTFSARTEEAAAAIGNKIKNARFDINFYRLLQDTFSDDIKGYSYRSYVVCPPLSGEVASIAILEKRPVWFVYSGMGSQWAGMASGLMALPVFAETIERLHVILEPHGMDLKTILTETGPNAFDCIEKSFVGITACQIALTNVLNALGVVPDGIVGHSVGELGCGYADGCLTEEQTIMAAFSRGAASAATELVKGKMAAIGLGYRDVLPLLPPSIDVACHNSSTSCTLSGPADDVDTFVKKLTEQGVFARVVNVSDIAYHSRYIKSIGPLLLENLKKVIPEPKPRSSKWISTSVPVDQRDSEMARCCSAEYQTNNLLSPVLLEEALESIPADGVLIEIAPHGLLQAILKRAMPEAVHISLTQRGQADPIRYLLNAVGRMSHCSIAPKVSALYPDVEFPVPRGTQSSAQMVLWRSDESTFMDIFQYMENQELPKEDFHNDSPSVEIGESRIYPLSEQLSLLWNTALVKDKRKQRSPFVSIENVVVKEWVALPASGRLTLEAHCSPATCEGAISYFDDRDRACVSVHARVDTTVDEAPLALPTLKQLEDDAVELSKQDLYRELSARGIVYSNKFMPIDSIRMGRRDWLITLSADCETSVAIEAMVQIFILRALLDESQELLLPNRIRRIYIDRTKLRHGADAPLRLHLATGILEGPGLHMEGVTLQPLPSELRGLRAAGALAAGEARLLPVGDTHYQTPEEFVRAAMRVALMDVPTEDTAEITFLELPNGRKTSRLTAMLVEATCAVGIAKVRAVTLTPEGTSPPGFRGRVPLLVTGPGTLAEATCALSVGLTDTLLVWSGQRLGDELLANSAAVAVLAQQGLRGDWLTLLRRAQPLDLKNIDVVEVTAGAPLPLSTKPGRDVVLVWRTAEAEAVRAAVEAVDALAHGVTARLVFVEDWATAPFSLPKALPHMERGFRVNVLAKEGAWRVWTNAQQQPQDSIAPSALLPTPSTDEVQVQYLGTTPLGRGRYGEPCPLDYVGVLRPQGGPGPRAVRVMGVCRWQSDDRVPVLDEALRWPVPAVWTSRDAATVPFVYALVYHSLQVQAGASRGESILVHEGTSAVGQAAIRVATGLGLSPLYTTVRSGRERDALLAMFPQLEPAHVFTCGDGGSFEYSLRLLTRGSGVRLVVNTLAGTEFHASLRCVGYFGRLLNFSREDLTDTKIGTHMFLLATAVYGCSGNELFHTTDKTRAQVVEAVAKGIQDGVVQPIVGAELFSAGQRIGELVQGTKAVIEVGEEAPPSIQQCDPHKCYVVVGSEAADALVLASRLAVLGARNILVAVGSAPSSPLVRQRQYALRRQLGAQLHVTQVRAWDASAAAGVLKAAAKVAPVHSAIVVVKEQKECAVATLLDTALQGAQGLVLLSDRSDLAAPLSDLARKRQALGRHASCLGASISEATDLLGGLLRSPSVAVLASASTDQAADMDHDLSLSLTAPALAALSRAKTQRSFSPRIVTLASQVRDPRAARENRSLFVLPPLGVLDQDSKSQLGVLAARLFSPVLVVETAPGNSVRLAAQAVVRTVLERQPHGPYNVLGWRLSTVLALEVQRQLEAASKCGALFLVHGDIARVRQWAAHRRHAGGVSVLDQVLEAVEAHEPDMVTPLASRVYVIRTRGESHSTEWDAKQPNVVFRTVSDRGLDDKELANYINENAAWSQLAGEADLRLAIELATTRV